MTEGLQNEEYLDLFKPKADSPDEGMPKPDAGDPRASEAQPDVPMMGDEDWDLPVFGRETVSQRTEQSRRPDNTSQSQGTGRGIGFESLTVDPDQRSRLLRTAGAIVGGGCLLLMLLAVVVFAFVQVFVRREGEDKEQKTATPTAVVGITPAPTRVIAKSPIIVPLVSSNDVRVPVALPEHLTMGDAVFAVEAVEAPDGAWPAAPAAVDSANWVYGTVVNYILGLAPARENATLIAGLKVGDILGLQMSSGLTLNFTVSNLITGATDDAALFEQVSPRLTLALLTDDLAQRTVVSAAFLGDEAGDTDPWSGAAIGLIGTPVDRGPVRVTVIEAYQVGAEQAGLPPGTGYLLMDLRIENVGTAILEPELFQTFVSDSAGERYPLTLLVEQFTHYGVPTEPLAPGETVIGSVGYLIPGSAGDQVRWAFNPLPGSDDWVVVPVSYSLPPPPATQEPAPPAGFARVTVDTEDVFINPADGVLDIGLRIENISDGVVQVTPADVNLSSWTNGELRLLASAPILPWVIEARELRLFQLQFELPTADSALLSVLGYTFSIENLGVE